MSMRLGVVLSILISLSMANRASAETTLGTLTINTADHNIEHRVPDCTLLHFHLPNPDPEGQIFSLEMLRSQSAASGPRVALAGTVNTQGLAKGTFGYRDDNDQQWLPAGEDLDAQQSMTLAIDGKPLPAWVETADRSKSEYVVELLIKTQTPLAAFTNSGLTSIGTATVEYKGQCTLNIPWLPDNLFTQ